MLKRVYCGSGVLRMSNIIIHSGNYQSTSQLTLHFLRSKQTSDVARSYKANPISCVNLYSILVLTPFLPARVNWSITFRTSTTQFQMIFEIVCNECKEFRQTQTISKEVSRFQYSQRETQVFNRLTPLREMIAGHDNSRWVAIPHLFSIKRPLVHALTTFANTF